MGEFKARFGSAAGGRRLTLLAALVALSPNARPPLRPPTITSSLAVVPVVSRLPTSSARPATRSC